MLLALSALGGCASITSSATNRLAGNLSTAILDQDDPETVEQGMPSYLLMVDGLIAGDPQNENMLAAGSKLYASYAAAFVKDGERAKRLSARARDYGERALCAHDARLCQLWARPFEEFTKSLGTLRVADVPVLYTSAAAWGGWIQANSSDWNAIAALPRVKAAMERVVQLDESYEHGEAHVYLGVIATLLPPAMGGKPEEGRAHFERAIGISQGRDLTAKVEYARRYARGVYDRALHDRLLNEVMAADARAPGLTLANVLAQRQAKELLATADRYF